MRRSGTPSRPARRRASGDVEVPRSDAVQFSAPFADVGPAALYLKRV